jgi:hypothetical protein
MSLLSDLTRSDDVVRKTSKALNLHNSGKSISKLKKKRVPSSCLKNKNAGLACPYATASLIHGSWLEMIRAKQNELDLTKIELCGAKVYIHSCDLNHVVGAFCIVVSENSKYIDCYELETGRVLKIPKLRTKVIIYCDQSQYFTEISNFGEPVSRHKRGIKDRVKQLG